MNSCLNKNEGSQDSRACMASTANQTLTEKVEMINKNVNEIISSVNEISYRIYGISTPKIERNCCTNEPVPERNSIENTINDIGSNSADIINMLSDILKDL